MKVICSSEESLYRPEAVRWRERMQLMKPIGDTVVLLPCSMKKPYSNSNSLISGTYYNFTIWYLSKGT